MSTIDQLLDAAKVVVKASNDSELAKALGIRPAAVSNYRRGVSLPNAVVCATLAGLTGEPLAKVLGIVGEARAISSDEKAVWRRLAATAMVVAIAVGMAASPTAATASPGSEKAGMYIMLNPRMPEVLPGPAQAGAGLDLASPWFQGQKRALMHVSEPNRPVQDWSLRGNHVVSPHGDRMTPERLAGLAWRDRMELRLA